MTDNFLNSATKRLKPSDKKARKALLSTLFASLFFFILIAVFTLLPLEDESGKTIETSTKLWTIAIAGAVVILLTATAYFINRSIYKSEGFRLDGEGISYDFTFIIKRFVNLPYQRVNTVKIKRSIVDMMLKLSVVKIESGSGASGFSEITLLLDKDFADYFADYLQRRAAAFKAGKEFSEEFMAACESSSCKSGDKLAISAGKANDMPLKDPSKAIGKTDCEYVSRRDKLLSVFAGEALYLTIIGFVSFFPFAIYFGLESDSGEKFSLRIALIASAIAAVVLAVLIVVIMLITVFVRFYDYKIYRKDDCIYVSYGLISKQSFSVNLDKIRGITISQGLFGQLFKVGRLRLNVVGLSEQGSNNQQCIKYLYPFGKISRLNQIIEKFLPEFRPNDRPPAYGQNQEPEKKQSHAFLHNFAIPTFWLTMFILPIVAFPAVLNSPLFLLFIPAFWLIMLVNALLLKRNCRLAVTEKLVFATSGGLYKCTVVLLTDSVQEISTFAGFIRQKQGLCSYRIFYRGDGIMGVNSILVRNLPKISLDRFV